MSSTTLDAGNPILPPATIGMLGGGQLGKYALVAANAMGYRTIVLDPDPNAPARVVADHHIVAAYDDAAALDELAERCAVVTTEFENPPAASLHRLANATRVAPSAACVAVAQDRFVEKAFMVSNDIAVGPHVPVAVGDSDALERAKVLADSKGGAVVKTARMGYDGKGQRRVGSSDELVAALADLGEVDCIVESMLDLRGEVSVLIGRTASGSSTTWTIADNDHVDGILDVSTVPSRVDDALQARAREIATSVAVALDYVGVLAVEMFIVASNGTDELLVNEIAPRPHNSGHWTLDASVTSQFEQQIRAICGVGLGATSMTAPAASMVNLLGDVWFAEGSSTPQDPHWIAALSDPDAALHLYGKTEPRPARKMGHLTVTGASPADAAALAVALRDALRR